MSCDRCEHGNPKRSPFRKPACYQHKCRDCDKYAVMFGRCGVCHADHKYRYHLCSVCNHILPDFATIMMLNNRGVVSKDICLILINYLHRAYETATCNEYRKKYRDRYKAMIAYMTAPKMFLTAKCPGCQTSINSKKA